MLCYKRQQNAKKSWELANLNAHQSFDKVLVFILMLVCYVSSL